MYVDRESHNEVNIRMMALCQDTPGWCYRERLQDEAKRKTQECVKGHLQEGEREPVRIVGGSGWPGHFRMK